MAVQAALYMLERTGQIQPTAPTVNREDRKSRQTRSIIMLDSAPATQLRIDPNDVSRRGELERRKLRAMIDFCYTEYCYRTHILDYFGDRNHERQCGTCSNCGPKAATVSSVPTEAKPRALADDEFLRVRKILACAKRMNGRFGRKILASTLRGSAAKQVLTARLNELSTYGLLRELSQDEIEIYIDALIAARCLKVNGRQYPTISTTELGDRVMREQERVELVLPI